MSSTSPSPNSPVVPQAPPPTTATPPPQSPPSVATPPPKPSASPPQPTPSSPPPPDAPPPSSNPPPQPSSPPPPAPPASSPPPPPTNQSTPVSPIAPVIPPPAPLVPSNSTPPSPTTKPPSPPAKPPQSSPPAPPLPKPPENSPPPPVPAHSRSSPPPPSSSSTTPVPPPPPSSDLPPPSAVLISPPPPSSASSVVPPGTPNTNSSGNNASKNSQPGGGGGLGTGGTVAIVLVVVLVFVGILGTVACYLRKRKKASGFNGGYIMPPFSRFNGGYVTPAFSGSSQESAAALLKLQISTPKDGSASGMGNIYSPRERGGFGNSRSCFTYEEMVKATNGFSPQNMLGEGGFGFVYKGTLTDGRVVAVKQLKIDGRQGEREFRSEVEIISRIHHRHLVSLVGYCINLQERLLVYDYVPNNNLYFHLHGEGRPVLDWATRVKIAVGAARGIAYLHEDCHPRIIHRDIKSSNILLDNNFEARVSDFGLAKLAQDVTHVSTRVVGTFGYMAPEYAASGKLTEKSDVYSFGVVLLELITGRKPVDTSQPSGAESLVEWARPVLSHALETLEFAGLADPKLGRQYVDSEMFRMIEAAAACVRHSSIRRPKMGQVLRALDTNASTDLTNGMRVGESEMFNPAQQSAELRLFQRMAFGNQEFTSGFFHQGSWISEGDQVNSRTTNE